MFKITSALAALALLTQSVADAKLVFAHYMVSEPLLGLPEAEFDYTSPS